MKHNSRFPRRIFLEEAALVSAVSLIAPTFAAPANPKWRLRLSTSSIHFKELSIERVCSRIAGLGFEAIDLWSAYEKCPHLDDALTRLGPNGLRELLAKHSLKLCGFSTYMGGYAKYAELLGKVGGGVAIQGSAAPCPPSELTSRMKEFLEGLKPLVELAEKYDSYLAIENHGNALLDSIDSFKSFVDLNRSPRLGVALAPYHLQSRKASVEDAIRICGRQLLFFYAWQNQPNSGQLPGHGPTDFKPWLAALAKIGYDRYVNPFMHGHLEEDRMSAALARSRDYLRACLKIAAFRSDRRQDTHSSSAIVGDPSLPTTAATITVTKQPPHSPKSAFSLSPASIIRATIGKRRPPYWTRNLKTNSTRQSMGVRQQPDSVKGFSKSGTK